MLVWCSVSDMARVGDPKTSVRWTPENHAWLVVQAGRVSGGKIGTVVQAVVTAAREADVARAAARRGEFRGGSAARAGSMSEDELVAGVAAVLASSGTRTVPGGAAPPPSGVAPARGRMVRLDVVVARVLEPGGGQIPPAALAAARREIKGGRVRVDGVAGALTPDMAVSPGAVVVDR